jgi:hypothetical protein
MKFRDCTCLVTFRHYLSKNFDELLARSVRRVQYDNRRVFGDLLNTLITVGTYLAVVVVSVSVGYLLGSSSIPGSRGPQTEIPQTTDKYVNEDTLTATSNHDGDLDRVKSGTLEEFKLVSHLNFLG